MRLEDLVRQKEARRRVRGALNAFRQAEDDSRGTVERVRCVLCWCSRGVRDWEVEIWKGVARRWEEGRRVKLGLMARSG